LLNSHEQRVALSAITDSELEEPLHLALQAGKLLNSHEQRVALSAITDSEQNEPLHLALQAKPPLGSDAGKPPKSSPPNSLLSNRQVEIMRDLMRSRKRCIGIANQTEGEFCLSMNDLETSRDSFTQSVATPELSLEVVDPHVDNASEGAESFTYALIPPEAAALPVGAALANHEPDIEEGSKRASLDALEREIAELAAGRSNTDLVWPFWGMCILTVAFTLAAAYTLKQIYTESEGT